VKFVLGIDVACRAAHQATLADQDGKFVWRGHRFWSTPEELEGVWARVIRKAGRDGEVQVVMEPTRNAWVLLAYWFTDRGASVVLVPTTQSADLRAYYCKHTKNDRLDSQVLARLPLLHPEGLHPFTGVGPADPLRRATRLRASLVERRTASQQRLDAYLEILGPGWYQALGTDFGKTALAVLGRYANPDTLLRLGKARLTQFLIRHSRGQWAAPRADLLLAAARQSQHLWGSDLDFAALAADIAVEVTLITALDTQISALEARIAVLYATADPDAIVASAPGVGATLAPVIHARLGDPTRFHNLAAVRRFSGLVPKVNHSGLKLTDHAGITKAGDPHLRQAVFLAADQARRSDPQLAATYKRLMENGAHHTSATCHIATRLLTRIGSCVRNHQPYVIRDINGTPLTPQQGRRIVQDRYQIDPAVRKANRKARASQTIKGRAGREKKESTSAPSHRPATHENTPQELLDIR
jgi:transposase